ncbi:uncharacterized protein BXZ73DRAFT_43677 [Epithele typhae]|uniref:uncharacterized protein n=1 Tax=Epithele typhae TaxID=378194 RepID=UPI002008251B|nr:uncharacterized protein BXZ73DRAFT_43677 [Epithele typhae]KAH9939654.1 hypothetical protein BXZ73DRAFT_43677 [Epithele typhae]
MVSQRSGLDVNISPALARPPNSAPRRRDTVLSGGTCATTRTLGSGEKAIEDRLKPTLDSAIKERDSAAVRAKSHGWSLNIAIGAQVVLGALTTGVAAATTGRQTSIATSILGGMSTLAASYLAKARGSNEPEASQRRVQDLESFVRDCEAFVMDHGHLVTSDYDWMIDRYRRRFEEIMGNGAEGVQEEATANSAKIGGGHGGGKTKGEHAMSSA